MVTVHQFYFLIFFFFLSWHKPEGNCPTLLSASLKKECYQGFRITNVLINTKVVAFAPKSTMRF